MSEIFLMVTAGIRCWYLVGGGQTRCSAPPYCTGRPPRYKYPASAVNSTQAETPRSRQRNIHSSLGTLRSVGETGIKQKQQLPYYVSPGKVRVLRGHGRLSLCTRASRQGCTRTSVWVTALHQPRLPTPGLLRCSLPLGHPPPLSLTAGGQSARGRKTGDCFQPNSADLGQPKASPHPVFLCLNQNTLQTFILEPVCLKKSYKEAQERKTDLQKDKKKKKLPCIG